MDLLDLKTLKRLAAACRKAGIKEFTGFGYSFILDEAPIQTSNKTKKKAVATQSVQASEFETDSPTEEQLLFWSATGAADNLSDTLPGVATE